jgi:hypothetical protein
MMPTAEIVVEGYLKCIIFAFVYRDYQSHDYINIHAYKGLLDIKDCWSYNIIAMCNEIMQAAQVTS